MAAHRHCAAHSSFFWQWLKVWPQSCSTSGQQCRGPLSKCAHHAKNSGQWGGVSPWLPCGHGGHCKPSLVTCSALCQQWEGKSESTSLNALWGLHTSHKPASPLTHWFPFRSKSWPALLGEGMIDHSDPLRSLWSSALLSSTGTNRILGSYPRSWLLSPWQDGTVDAAISDWCLCPSSGRWPLSCCCSLCSPSSFLSELLLSQSPVGWL